MRKVLICALGVAALAVAGGCTTTAPTIAHTHIGHAITGWQTTPDNAGLLVTAENEAAAMLKEARRAATPGNDLAQTKDAVRGALHALDPALVRGGGAGLGFGLLPAVQQTISHMEFAAESDDVSRNVRDSVPGIAVRSDEIIGRCEEVRVLGQAVMSSASSAESATLAAEILTLSEDISDGSASGTYGLAQMRAEIEAMIGRESPRYTTVKTWYLLNLVRLPSGKWDFVQQDEKSGDGRGAMHYY